MTTTTMEDAEQNAAPNKKKPLIMGALGAAVLGGAAFYVTFSGLLFGPTPDAGAPAPAAADAGHGAAPADTGYAAAPADSGAVEFVTLEPMTISLGKYATSRHLRFSATIETAPGAAGEVAHLSPRILDVLNTYLRAVSEQDLEDPASMDRLRAQMLRRVQLVAGRENVRDLLITEFVLN